MRKFGLVSLLALFAAACGDGSDNDAAIVIADGGPSEPDATPQRGNIADFDTCQEDLDCENLVSECVPVAFYSGTPKICLPKCNSTDSCPMDTVCWPTGGGNYSGVEAMGDHCWFSLCGGFITATGQSNTGEACVLGRDSGVGPEDELPGYCLSIEDGDFGQCIEVGDLAPGETCDFDNALRTRGGANCDDTSLCLGQFDTAGNPSATGTCGQICDPTVLLTDGDPGCDAVPGTQCQDSSDVGTSSDGTHVSRATLGFCTEVVACKLIGPNTCPPSSDTPPQAQGCAFTNPLRPTGICDPSGTGALAAGASCPFNASSDAQECTAGTICIGDGTTNSCLHFCRMPGRTCTAATAAADCAPTQTCDTASGACTPPFGAGPDFDCASVDPTFECGRVRTGDGFDATAGTPDDDFSEDWGVCGPPG